MPPNEESPTRARLEGVEVAAPDVIRAWSRFVRRSSNGYAETQHAPDFTPIAPACPLWNHPRSTPPLIGKL